jgi:cytochrome c553
LTGGSRKDQEQGEQCVGDFGVCQRCHDRRGRERRGSEEARPPAEPAPYNAIQHEDGENSFDHLR